EQFHRPAEDTAGLVDAVDCHLQADQRGLAAGCGGARERLLRTELVRLGGAKCDAPRRRHEHGRPERAGGAGAPADEPAAADFAAVQEFLRIMRVAVVSHAKSSHRRADTKPPFCQDNSWRAERLGFQKIWRHTNRLTAYLQAGHKERWTESDLPFGWPP